MFPNGMRRGSIAIDDATEEPIGFQQTPGRAGLRIPPLTDMLQLIALAGAVVYGALFTGYRAFYAALGIDPENVGISNTYILARSIGFLIFTAAVTLIWFGMTRLVNNTMNKRSGKLWRSIISYGYNAAIAIFIGIIIVKFYVSPEWPFYAKAAVIVLVVGLTVALTRVANQSSPNDRRKMGAVAAVFVGFLVSITAINHYAVQLADEINAGNKIIPFAIFKIPILDVSSDDVEAAWMCPEAQEPDLFKNAKDSSITGLLVGESETSYIIRLSQPPPTGSEIVSIPQNCAVLTRINDSGP